MRPSPGPGRGLIVPVLIGLLGVAGCGPGVATVTGKVSYKGTPLKGGNITFVSTEGKPTISDKISESGTYTLRDVPTGTVTICVETESLKTAARAPVYSAPPGMTNPNAPPPNQANRYVPIPTKYADTATSGLSYKVVGSQTHDIELTD